jgi:hypothetical protein
MGNRDHEMVPETGVHVEAAKKVRNWGKAN